MIETERIKADLEAIAKQEEEEKAVLFEAKVLQEKEKRELMVKQLTDEPAEGELISIAFRLPNGARLTRNFRKEEPIKVDFSDKFLFAYIYSQSNFENGAKVDMLYDYPPVKIKEEQLENTFGEFFQNSDRPLINVTEEEL